MYEPLVFQEFLRCDMITIIFILLSKIIHTISVKFEAIL